MEERGNASSALRSGWTTGACAAAAAKSAFTRLRHGEFSDPVSICLPRGDEPFFPLCSELAGEGESPLWAEATIVKDAGDDPDVTHGAHVSARVDLLPAGSGLQFCAGEGVGRVTRPGLPIPVGEPAINPMPRKIIEQALRDVIGPDAPLDVKVTISIAGGAALALKTMNPRLGIVGGLSVLGTTGVVRPFSCASWIASIHRGVDVARASGIQHVLAATGATSEDALRQVYPDMAEHAYLDMGDFAGGLLKYLRAHPVPRLTLAGGPAKLLKLAQGAMDLHSARSQVDFKALSNFLTQRSAPAELAAQAAQANTVKQISDQAVELGYNLGDEIAESAKEASQKILRGAPVQVEVFVFDRQGKQLGSAPCRKEGV